MSNRIIPIISFQPNQTEYPTFDISKLTLGDVKTGQYGSFINVFYDNNALFIRPPKINGSGLRPGIRVDSCIIIYNNMSNKPESVAFRKFIDDMNTGLQTLIKKKLGDNKEWTKKLKNIDSLWYYKKDENNEIIDKGSKKLLITHTEKSLKHSKDFSGKSVDIKGFMENCTYSYIPIVYISVINITTKIKPKIELNAIYFERAEIDHIDILGEDLKESETQSDNSENDSNNDASEYDEIETRCIDEENKKV